MTYEQVWLLETVLLSNPPTEYQIPLWAVHQDHPDPNDVGLQWTINAGRHLREDPQMVEAMLELFQLGDIEFLRGSTKFPSGTTSVRPTAHELFEALVSSCREEEWLTYTLTQKGFDHWEQFAKPNWSLFTNSLIGDEWDLVGWSDIPADIRATTAGSIEAARSLFFHCYYSTNEFFVWDRMAVTTISPWHVFPWKSLPIGYRVKVPITHEQRDLLPFELEWCGQGWPEWIGVRSELLLADQ